jgi:hypothetical protein
LGSNIDEKTACKFSGGAVPDKISLARLFSNVSIVVFIVIEERERDVQ